MRPPQPPMQPAVVKVLDENKKNFSIWDYTCADMRSSKMENIFNYPPPVEEAKSFPPFAYYQPFRSGFDPVNVSKSPGGREIPPQMKRLGRGSPGSLHGSGGGVLTPTECEDGPRTFPGASTSTWGESEGRSLCNSTWRIPRPSFSRYEEGQGSKSSIPGASGSGMQFQKTDGGFPALCRPGMATLGTSLCQSPPQTATFEGSLTPSPYYPLGLNPLGKNTSQNMYKTGHSRPMMCNFCKNNKEVPDIYLNHYLYDPATKILSCPVLRRHVCEVCGGTGDQAHTLQYCPVNRERGLQSKFPVLLKTRTITNSTGKIRRN